MDAKKQQKEGGERAKCDNIIFEAGLYKYLNRMNNMRHSHMLEQASTRPEEPEHKHHHHHSSRLCLSGESIRVNKNEIGYAKLSPPVKDLFREALKQIQELSLMKQVFSRWEDQHCIAMQPRKVQLTDHEAFRLIYRMHHILDSHSTAFTINDIKEEVEHLQLAYASYQASLHTMNKTHKCLNQMVVVREKRKEEKREIEAKLISFRNDSEQQMMRIQQKILQKNQQMEKQIQKLLFGNAFSRKEHVLVKSIKKQVRNLLRQSIIFIIETTRNVVLGREAEQQEVYVVFEQAYQTKKIKKKAMVKIIGSEIYLQKVDKFNDFIMTQRKLPLREQQDSRNMLCCHRCMKICKKSELKFCTTKTTKKQTNSYPSTDYFSYRKMHLEGDYFYEATEQQVLPFFQYNQNQSGHDTCNRAFCHDCIAAFRDQNEKKIICLYCAGFCNCARCEKASGLVKMIALDYENDRHQVRKYHDVLRLFRGNNREIVSECLKLRIPGPTNNQIQVLQEVWKHCNSISLTARLDFEVPFHFTFPKMATDMFEFPEMGTFGSERQEFAMRDIEEPQKQVFFNDQVEDESRLYAQTVTGRGRRGQFAEANLFDVI